MNNSDDLLNSMAELKDELKSTLDFIKKVIEKDRTELEAYFNKFGDLYYRHPEGENSFGPKTELVKEPLASKFRMTIKSLLDSVALIEGKIKPLEEGDSGQSLNTIGDDIPEGSYSPKDAMERAKEIGAKRTIEEPDIS